MSAAVLAHQGGWDEILMVAAPVIGFVSLLVVAKRRADEAGGSEPPEASRS